MKPFDKPILVTRPYLPDLKAYQDGIAEIWSNQWLTNNGPVLQRYVRSLEAFFGTTNVCAFNNGTLALQIALQGMSISGEVITTPFTFVATSHCLVWNNIRPVFVDVDPATYTINPESVEAAVTPQTTAILAVHVFGQPCHLKELQAIADRHKIHLIYDAAHAFGVKVDDKDIGLFGDCSMFSLHSTKLYHSIEGGLLTFSDAKYKKTFEYLRNFGFENEVEVMMVGTNAKMNEMQALMGNLMLPQIPSIIEKRKRLTRAYLEGLRGIPGVDLHFIENAMSQSTGSKERRGGPSHVPSLEYTPNFAYVPVEISEDYGVKRDALYEALKTYNVFTRRYFYPLLTEFQCYKGSVGESQLPVARGVADRIITLPIYFDLEVDDVSRICEMVRLLRCAG